MESELSTERRWRNGHAPYQAVTIGRCEKEYALSMESWSEGGEGEMLQPYQAVAVYYVYIASMLSKEEYSLIMEQRRRDAKYQAAATLQ